MSRVVTTRSPEETERLAAGLAKRSKPGDVICLIGPLGSGKTTFAKGFARGAGFKGDVTSPSFGLVREYRAGRRTVYHMDLFRVAPREIPNLGLEEYFADPRGICLIEWPGAARRILPKRRLEIRFSHRKDGRLLRLSDRGGI